MANIEGSMNSNNEEDIVVSPSSDRGFCEEMEHLKPLNEDDDIMKEMLAVNTDVDDQSQASMLIGLTPTASPFMMLDNPSNINGIQDTSPSGSSSSKVKQRNTSSKTESRSDDSPMQSKSCHEKDENTKHKRSSSKSSRGSYRSGEERSIEKIEPSSGHYINPHHAHHSNRYGSGHPSGFHSYGSHGGRPHPTHHHYGNPYPSHPPHPGMPYNPHYHPQGLPPSYGSYNSGHPPRNGPPHGPHRDYYGHHGGRFEGHYNELPPPIIKSASSCSDSVLSSSPRQGHSHTRRKNQTKGTIDGIEKDNENQSHQNNAHFTFSTFGNLPNSYSIRRTGSNVSTCSSSTANNTTSLDTSLDTTSSPVSLKNNGSRNKLPPTSSNSTTSPSRGRRFHRSTRDGGEKHRRSHSNSSCSTLSVGETSMNSSYSRRRRRNAEDNSNYDKFQIESSKRRRHRHTDSYSSSGSSFERFDDYMSKMAVNDSGSTSATSQNAPPTSASSNSAFFRPKPGHHRRISSTSTSGGSKGTTSKAPVPSFTSPIANNNKNRKKIVDPDATPLNKNTTRDRRRKTEKKNDVFNYPDTNSNATNIKNMPFDSNFFERDADSESSPNPSLVIPKSNGGATISISTDGDLTMEEEDERLNKHLREQCFTPLPLRNKSPFNPSFSAIAPQLSWSIAGDTTALGDIGDWESPESRGPSPAIRGATPMSFWDEPTPLSRKRDGTTIGTKDDFASISLALSCSPTSTTPRSINSNESNRRDSKSPNLPVFFSGRDDEFNEDQENKGNYHNQKKYRGKSKKSSIHEPAYPTNSEYGESSHIHQMFITNGGRDSKIESEVRKPKPQATRPSFSSQSGHNESWENGSQYSGRHPSEQRENTRMRDRRGFGRQNQHSNGNYDSFYGQNPAERGNPHNRMGHCGMPPPSIGYGSHMRGRHGPPPPHMGGTHPHHIPLHHPHSHMGQSHDPHAHRIAPMGGPPHWVGPPPHHQPPHMHHMDLSRPNQHSKRKCVPLKTPIPSKFQGDIEQMKDAPVPEFTSLVNFPLHMTAKQSSFADGMRCCVMCGHARPCSVSNKNKKEKCSQNKKESNAKHHRQNSGSIGGGCGHAIIPTQNKGLCTICDVNIWVVTQNRLEIKWCKGCKNFRPWAAFGEKGLATKCVRCRERQREKYAMQKEEKEKAKSKLKTGAKDDASVNSNRNISEVDEVKSVPIAV